MAMTVHFRTPCPADSSPPPSITTPADSSPPPPPPSITKMKQWKSTYFTSVTSKRVWSLKEYTKYITIKNEMKSIQDLIHSPEIEESCHCWACAEWNSISPLFSALGAKIANDRCRTVWNCFVITAAILAAILATIYWTNAIFKLIRDIDKVYMNLKEIRWHMTCTLKGNMFITAAILGAYIGQEIFKI